MDTYAQALRYRSGQSLRDSLDFDEFNLSEGVPQAEKKEDAHWAVLHLYCHVQLLTEMMKRLWDEFEGHQDFCRIQKIVKEFCYPPVRDKEELEQFVKQIEKENKMDKQIKKVEKDVKKGKKGKAVKDIKVLKKMDKKFDKKVDKAKKVMKKKGC